MDNIVKNLLNYIEQLKSIDVPTEAKDKINSICHKLGESTAAIEEIFQSYIEKDDILLETETDYQQILSSLTAIMNNMADGLLVTDELGMIIQYNPALLTMFELTQTEIIAKQCKDIFSNELTALIERVLKDRQDVIEGEIALPHEKIGRTMK
ncbi:MAG: PAS domain-containing protein [Nitrospirae bacterium]|nr:PAS domain-containing protein [Nitrospirota bacterium]